MMSPYKYHNKDSLTCCEETIELTPFPLCDLHKSSTIAFNIDDGIVKTELTDLRSYNGSICSSSFSFTNELSDTYKNFKKTIKIFCLLVIAIFLMAALWIAFLWWDHINNHEHGKSDQITNWKRKIFSS